MPRTAEQYRDSLMLLLPKGDIWAGADIEQLMTAVAPEYQRMESRMEDLLDESDPRSVADLIDDWERDWGLPTNCTGPLALLSERRNALVNRMIGIPDQSRQTYIDRAVQVGYVITITEFSAGDVVPGIPAADAAFAVQINAPLDTVQARTMGSPMGEAFSSWGNTLLECSLNEIAQSHHFFIFSYT